MGNSSECALPGAVGLTQDSREGVAAVGRTLMDERGLDVDTATHLCGVYGSRAPLLAERMRAEPALAQRLDPELPYVWAEIEFAVTHDLARTIEDVLGRRVPLLLVGRNQGLDVCERVGDLMARLLDWSPAQRGAMLDEYRAEVGLSRRWKEGS